MTHALGPVLLFLLLLAGGCKYQLGPEGLERPQTQRAQLPQLAVEPFDNVTYRRGLEILLTQFLNDEVRGRTGFAPVRAGEADLILRGKIVTADEVVLSDDVQDRVAESMVVIVVQVDVWDPAAQKTVRTYSLREREPFSPAGGRIRTFDQAAEEALRDLAEQIVYGLETDGPKLKKAP